MIKKKQKNNKKNKKKERNIERVKKQQEELDKDKDDGQAENYQKRMLDEEDKEQRRTTRLGAIITIVAIVGTICTVLIKTTVSVLNVWSEQGVLYWYMQALFLLTLSTAVIIFFDIVGYVISDLKRYDVENVKYKQYDVISDSKYKHLLEDFRIYIWMLLGVAIMIILLPMIYAEKSQRMSGILGAVVLVIVIIIRITTLIRGKSKEELKNILLYTGVRFVEWVLVGMLCYIIGVSLVLNNRAVIEVDYNADGTVEICNKSAENYNGLDIEISNMNNQIIYKKSIEKEQLLFAKEDKYVNDEVDGKKVAQGILINNEWLHWKYIYDLKEIVSDSEKYYLSITVHQDGKSAVLINSLFLDDEEYIFAKDHMNKVY